MDRLIIININEMFALRVKKKYIASQQRWQCGHCNNLLDNTYEVVSIIPLYKGGSNELHNLTALCGNCHGVKTFKDKMGL